MMKTISRVRAWWRDVTTPKCKHRYLIARFRIVEEIGIAYEQCAECGKVFDPE